MIETGAVLFARLVVVLTLVPAVSAKMWYVERVRNALAKWRVVPLRLTGPLAWALIVSEMVVLLTVSSGVAIRFGAIVAVALFAAVVVAAETVVIRGIATSCNCFSLEGTEKVTHITAIRSLGLCILAVVVVLGSTWSLQPRPAWSALLATAMLPLVLALVRRARLRRGYDQPTALEAGGRVQ